ncbi:hypothetical protein VM98_25270 [Streptomyces rubellomurinus subsp. indigoferus]|nr:hypothetical protein VM98_25270 [Streptomyces rubellomurinus subsp. indigoferus]
MEYTIMQIYKVSGRTQVEATDRFMEAIELGVQRDYLVRSVIRPEEGRYQPLRIVRRTTWWEIIWHQLLGR